MYETAFRKVEEMSLGVTGIHLLLVYVMAIEVVGAVLLAQRWDTRRVRAFAGQTVGCPLSSCPTTSHLTPFFWRSKVRVANVAVWRTMSEAVAKSMQEPP